MGVLDGTTAEVENQCSTQSGCNICTVMGYSIHGLLFISQLAISTSHRSNNHKHRQRLQIHICKISPDDKIQKQTGRRKDGEIGEYGC